MFKNSPLRPSRIRFYTVRDLWLDLGDFAEDHSVVTGAVAVAVGLLVGWLLF